MPVLPILPALDVEDIVFIVAVLLWLVLALIGDADTATEIIHVVLGGIFALQRIQRRVDELSSGESASEESAIDGDTA